MKSKRKNNLKQNNLSLRRRLFVYYYRFVIFLRLLLFVVILLFAFTDLFTPIASFLRTEFNRISSRYGFVLENLIIAGQENMPINDIIAALQSDKGRPLFEVDITNTSKILENSSWIQNVVIQRRLPHTIYIAIVEKKPIAIWQYNQQLYLIDEEGERISDKEIVKFKGLLHVVGSDANVYASSLIQKLDQFPELAKKVSSAARYGQRRWNLNLQQEITVKMPEKNFNRAYKYLNALYKANKLFDQGYKVLDLRDPERYYLTQ